ncbi:MAG TPA: sodium/glutamate symporter [Candidatus Saccharimonadales bacterium]
MPPLADSLIVLAIILVLARFIKRGSNVLQRFFIPSSLVAGIGGLILGPQILQTIPADITDYWSTFPKYLITVVFAGLFLGRYIPSRKEIWKQAGPMIAFGNTMAWAQYVLGIVLVLLFLTPVFGTNPLAASLLEISFAGGHGTAAGLQPTFEQLGWSEGTDIALGLATLSIITAVASGILFINIHHRRHSKAYAPEEREQQRRHLIRSGYNLIRFAEKLSTHPKAILINAVAFALAISIGWLLLEALQHAEVWLLSGHTDARFFAYVPLFPLAMIGGLIVQLILKKIKKQHLIQRRTAEVFSAIALDLLIASALATVSLNAIGNNLAVFITLGIAGIALIMACFFLLAPRMFNANWFERGVTDYGQAMGMTATGLLLNRMADPANKLKVREAFAYKQLIFEPFMGGGLVTAMAVIFMYEFGLLPVLIVSSVIMLFWLVLGLHLGRQKVSP